jgi:23S rRNA (adenine2503-C2)-methyltransferase
LAKEPLQIRLAVSLHGATDAVREQIMPVNRKYPIASLMEACAEYSRLKKQMITFEYILIEGVNDMPAQAKGLVDHCKRLHAKVNLIPYNTVEGLDWRRPDEASVQAFATTLERGGVPVTVRREKGGDINAACGQLRLRQKRL